MILNALRGRKLKGEEKRDFELKKQRRFLIRVSLSKKPPRKQASSEKKPSKPSLSAKVGSPRKVVASCVVLCLVNFFFKRYC
jgi:hypothetical protein